MPTEYRTEDGRTFSNEANAQQHANELAIESENERSYRSCFALGDQLKENGNLHGAYEAYIDAVNHALRLKEHSRRNDYAARAYHQCGNMVHDMEDYENAVMYFTESLKCRRNLSDYYTYYWKIPEDQAEYRNGIARSFLARGRANFKWQKFDDAIADFTEVISMEGKYSGDAYNDRGVTYKKKENFYAAMADYRRGAEAGNEDAKTNLANNQAALAEWNALLAQAQKDFDGGNYENALAAFEKLSATGCAEAQNAIGMAHRDGKGRPQDAKTAADCFRQAGDSAFSYDEFENSAVFYANGAELDDPWSQMRLGFQYHSGRGVQQDMVLAVELWRKSAAGGQIDAMLNLGVCHEKGLGVTRNVVVAGDWYFEAKRGGHNGADAALQNLKNVTKKILRKPWKNVLRILGGFAGLVIGFIVGTIIGNLFFSNWLSAVSLIALIVGAILGVKYLPMQFAKGGTFFTEMGLLPWANAKKGVIVPALLVIAPIVTLLYLGATVYSKVDPGMRKIAANVAEKQIPPETLRAGAVITATGPVTFFSYERTNPKYNSPLSFNLQEGDKLIAQGPVTEEKKIDVTLKGEKGWVFSDGTLLSMKDFGTARALKNINMLTNTRKKTGQVKKGDIVTLTPFFRKERDGSYSFYVKKDDASGWVEWACLEMTEDGAKAVTN